MIKRSAVAVSCLVFMCGSAARADLVPFDPADLEKAPTRVKKNKDESNKDKKTDPKKAEDSKEKAK